MTPPSPPLTVSSAPPIPARPEKSSQLQKLPPPKPPLSTKPPVLPKKKLPIQATKATASTTTTTDDMAAALTKTPTPPPRSNKPPRVLSSVYIAPSAAPLDPAMDTSQQDKTRQLRREQRQQKEALKDAQVIADLQAICTDADPTKLYRNMIKIGQG